MSLEHWEAQAITALYSHCANPVPFPLKIADIQYNTDADGVDQIVVRRNTTTDDTNREFSYFGTLHRHQDVNQCPVHKLAMYLFFKCQTRPDPESLLFLSGVPHVEQEDIHKFYVAVDRNIVPETSLKKKVFPWLEKSTGTDYRTACLMELFSWLSGVLLQDWCFTQPILQFQQDYEFKEFRLRVKHKVYGETDTLLLKIDAFMYKMIDENDVLQNEITVLRTENYKLRTDIGEMKNMLETILGRLTENPIKKISPVKRLKLESDEEEDGPVKYKLSRENKTVQALVQEWYYGLDGKPSIVALVEKFGWRRWKVADDSHFFPTRRIIIEYIETEVDRAIKDHRYEQDMVREAVRECVVEDIEDFRIQNGLSLNSLSLYLKNVTRERGDSVSIYNEDQTVRLISDYEKNTFCKRQGPAE